MKEVLWAFRITLISGKLKQSLIDKMPGCQIALAQKWFVAFLVEQQDPAGAVYQKVMHIHMTAERR